jgi:hypothetical protein
LPLGVGHIRDADERLTGHRHNAKPQPKSPVNIALWLPFWMRASGVSVPDAGTGSRAFIPR